jgi:peroxiredoxin
MKTKLLGALAALALLMSTAGIQAAESGTATELGTLVKKIQTKIKEGKKTEADLADEMKEFDTLLAQHKGEKTDDVAQILLMKAMLYLEVFEDSAKGTQLVQQLKTDFPGTKPAKAADGILDNIKKHDEAEKIQKTLAVGNKFPDFEEKDYTGSPLSVGNYKGKVVLVDFWATWCGPCVQELPNVIRAYDKHHSQGLEIIGISLDQDEKKLKDFTKQMKMAWPQYYDGKGWNNKLAAKYGIQSIPATFLLDGTGTIIGRNLRGEALEEALSKALAKKS